MSISRGLRALPVIGMLAATSAMAEYHPSMTGDALLAACKGLDPATMQPDPAAEARCLGYIAGVADLWGTLRALRAVQAQVFDLDFCFPASGIEADKTIQTVRDHLAGLAAGERAEVGAESIVIVALAKAFPCHGE